MSTGKYQQTPQASVSFARPTQNPNQNPRSCHTCRRRKVKCDKVSPCSNCVRSHAECVFPGPGRAPRKPRVGKGNTERETELLKRLRRLEGVVEELSGQIESEAAGKASSSSPDKEEENGENGSPNISSKPYGEQVRVTGVDEGIHKRQCLTRVEGFGQEPAKLDTLDGQLRNLVIDEGKSRYVGSDFWARLNLEVDDIREMVGEIVEDVSDDEELSPENQHPQCDDTNHQSFILGYASSDVDLLPLHPLPSQISFYWDVYVENVDPLCKFIHVPTMSSTIKRVRENLDSLRPSTEALMFGIYFAAITSLTDEEVRSSLGDDRQDLLRRYRFGLEQALARASFLNTSEIVTVQAFVLFLVCVRRHDDGRSIWSLVGLAIRLAQALGLHRDGAILGLSPFDTEMRRRLWWQICALDTRASEDYGSDPTILEASYDCKFPLNLNDSDICPNTTETPVPREGISDMTFCLIRYEICVLSRRLGFVPYRGPCHDAAKKRNLAEKEKMICDLHEHLEITYLRYCNDAGPLFWVAATIARLVVSKMNLMIHGFRSPKDDNEFPQEIRDRLFVSAVEVAEYTRLLETEGSTKKWGWLFHTYVQWYAIAFVLREICVRPPSAIVDRGWHAVNGVFGGCIRSSSNNGILWVTIRKLMIKARRKRQADLQAGTGAGLMMTPEIPQPSTDTLPSTMALVRGSKDEPAPSLGLAAAIQPDFPAGETWPAEMHSMPPTQEQLPPLAHYPLMSQEQPSSGWLLDDPALVDLDMNVEDGEIDWEGWDDVVRNYQVEIQHGTADANVPNLGSMGGWW
ncbi:MAG: hypothetical protein M1818_003619 [Claussenomyces sp. TS43310]|nr:MAG: hypothetical protein M1818_003619 [Claussenomyces sp. TS43310]